MLYNNLSAKNVEVNAVSLCTNLDLSLFLSLCPDSGWEASRWWFLSFGSMSLKVGTVSPIVMLRSPQWEATRNYSLSLWSTKPKNGLSIAQERAYLKYKPTVFQISAKVWFRKHVLKIKSSKIVFSEDICQIYFLS